MRSKFFLVLVLLLACVTQVNAAYVQGEVVIQFKEGISETRIAEISQEVGANVKSHTDGKLYLFGVKNGASVEDTIKKFQEYREVELASPNSTLQLQ
jgi:isopentenyl diphosphate isomerase/L-lactate dehydrogenase-like FMN-dependent dehydrogenase